MKIKRHSNVRTAKIYYIFSNPFKRNDSLFLFAAGQQTVFSSIMGTMANLSAFKYININVYLPMVLVVHCMMVALGVWDRLLNIFVAGRFRFSKDDVDDEYTEKVSRQQQSDLSIEPLPEKKV